MIVRPIILTVIVTVCNHFTTHAQNVGIGTTLPESKLQVAGKITADSLKIIEGAAKGKILTSDSAGNAKWMPSANITTVKNGIVNDTGAIKLGGALTQKTNIETGDYHLKIGKTGPVLTGQQLVNNISPSALMFNTSNLWQSFTSPQDGVLDSIQITTRIIAGSNAQAYLYEGSGIAGTLLATSDPFSYPGFPTSTRVTAFKTAVTLEAEKIYTIYITNVGGWEVALSSTYPYGTSSLSFGDFNFIVYGSYRQHSGIVLKNTGEVNISGNASITGRSMLEFGEGIFPKEINAGKIGYQSFTADALDIVGAGTNETNRKIVFWNEGGATFNGAISSTNLSLSGSISQEAVHVPLLDGGWIAFGGGYAPPAYWKDKEGVVHLRGLIRNPAPVPVNGTLLFTLPPGYRPTGGRLMFAVINNNNMGRIEVSIDGDVTAEFITSNAWINLTGISFRTN
jgi:hypothetical protein